MEKSDGYLWYEPYHMKGSPQDTTLLQQILFNISGRNAYLKPDEPPPIMLNLLARMSTRTVKERHLVEQVLKLYADRIRLKNLGHLSGPSVKKELKNPKGLAADRQFQLTQSVKSLEQVFMRDVVRRRLQARDRQNIVDKFNQTFMEQRVQQRAIDRLNARVAEMRAALTAQRRVDESTILARYDFLGSELSGQKTFYKMWRQRTGPPAETFSQTEVVWAKKMREQGRRGNHEDLEQKERALEE
eukprot:CAMPEP_0173456106 /NCGR_PEP_ID=MMETSP1357-20121228/55487_1 /TAXON_ID=77926 /ORGANISM="Hemiselmis rufescens, Strain PCC563" /LENGTH=243 /DNA_ID=CAMNT_0014423293 /DNA_START=42 /DNA_END=770 /DNA_ORIENTATION=+